MLKKKIWLVQQGVWSAKASNRPPPMPLVGGYLKAAIESDERLRDELDVRIFSLSGGDSLVSVLRRLFFEEIPDLVAFSVLGWNYALFGNVAETFRLLNPKGWVVFGGTHVANQARRTFGMFPAVDVVVNGEGEWVFLDLLRAWLGGASRHELGGIQSISFRDGADGVTTTPTAGRIRDLDEIPSPFLSGAMPLVDERGNFLYDNALLETNRGCPYRCSFCYWGGATGQKLRVFSMDRLREEVEVLARAGATEIMLCDANFGILPQDEEFIEICIRARERYGYPRHIMTSWAKDKRKSFYRIVERMNQAGFHSSFNLALQSLSEPALEDMQRRNMRINEWQDLADWLHGQGMAVYAELIWGCPGETFESFLDGYDRLARHVSRVATYPLLLLPNTAYVERKDELGMVTWRGENDDFERVLQHKTMSIADNCRMHRFLFWARVICEHHLLRYVWRPLDRWVSVTQSQLLLTLDGWLDEQQDDPAAARLKACRDQAVAELDVGAANIERGLQFFFTDGQADDLMHRWWREAVSPRVDEGRRGVFLDLFRYDWTCRPVYAPNGTTALPVERRDGRQHYVRRGVWFDYDILRILAESGESDPLDAAPSPIRLDFHYRTGFCNDIALYHNAHNEQYFGIAELPSECRHQPMGAAVA